MEMNEESEEEEESGNTSSRSDSGLGFVASGATKR
jgi:hypothetical protein